MDNLDFKVITNSEQSVSDWSGGTTTELFIYPEGSDYKKRNFGFRISSAKVNLDQSTFTSLPGVHRIIMVLDGEMKLVYKDHYDINLCKYDQDSFDGEWTTQSYGKVTDFNLMTKDDYNGSVESINIDGFSMLRLDKKKDSEVKFETFYAINDGIKVALNEDSEVVINKGDFLVIKLKEKQEIDIKFSCEELKCTVIRTTVSK